jgi:hypothetical protein
VGAQSDAARARVLTARADLLTEVERLEAAGRAAVDVPAKVRRNPGRTVGLAAGAAFLVGGGPGRVFRRVRRAVKGPDADLPKSMLPKEIEKTLKKMGTDGDRVRGTLEREFASYLEDHADERRSRQLGGFLTAAAGALLKPSMTQAGKRLAQTLFSPDSPGFEEQLRRIRDRDRDPGTSAGPGRTPPG